MNGYLNDSDPSYKEELRDLKENADEEKFEQKREELRMNKHKLFDMDGKEVENGHIVAVRYVWNSYVGEASFRGLLATGAKRHAFSFPHSYEDYATYQILGHTDKSHTDFNDGVFDWYNSEKEGYECPVKIRIYENIKSV